MLSECRLTIRGVTFVTLLFTTVCPDLSSRQHHGFSGEIRNWKTEAEHGRAAGQTDATAAGPGGMQVLIK